ARAVAGGGRVRRGDRTPGRAASVDRVVLDGPLGPPLGVCRDTRGSRPDRTRGARRAGGSRLDGPGDRGGTRSEPDDRALLAEASRPGDDTTRAAVPPSARRDPRVSHPRSHAVRPPERRTLSVRTLSRRLGHSMEAAG